MPPPTSSILPTGPLDGQTSYQESFSAANPQDRVRPIRQPNQLIINKASPGHFMTSNQAAFNTILINSPSKAASFKPAQTAAVMTPFAGSSSYQSQFPGCQPPDVVVRAKAPKETLQRAPAAPGTFTTTNQMSHSVILQALRDGTIGRTSPVRQKDNTVGVVSSPFEGKSSYQEQYATNPDSPLRLRSPRRRQNPSSGTSNVMHQSSENRDFLTTSGASFQRVSRTM